MPRRPPSPSTCWKRTRSRRCGVTWARGTWCAAPTAGCWTARSCNSCNKTLERLFGRWLVGGGEAESPGDHAEHEHVVGGERQGLVHGARWLQCDRIGGADVAP